MSTYIAMLRGINVGGQKMVKMDRLRASFEALGFAQVQTYLQSGNVVFKAGKGSPADLTDKIEKRILRDFGFPVTVVLRTAAELKETIRDNPFLKEKGIDATKLHVTFLSEAPASVERLASLDSGSDRFRHSGKEVHLHCPDGYGRTKLSNNALEKALSVRATTRNWNTVNRLCEMSSGG